MKVLRKVGIFVLILSLGLILIGCGNEAKSNENIEGSLEEIMTKVYSQLPEDERPMGLTNIEVNTENVEGFLGTSEIKYEEALASESMVGSIAHSVVLVRVAEDANVEEVKSQIKDNVNPRKWICVGVEEDQVIVKNKGNLIILIMAAQGSDKLEAGFDGLE